MVLPLWLRKGFTYIGSKLRAAVPVLTSKPALVAYIFAGAAAGGLVGYSLKKTEVVPGPPGEPYPVPGEPYPVNVSVEKLPMEMGLDQVCHPDLDAVKKLVDPSDNQFWSDAAIYNLQEVDKKNSSINFIIDEVGQGSLYVNLKTPTGWTNKSFGKLNTSATKDAFAKINGKTNGLDAIVYSSPAVESYGIVRKVAAEDISGTLGALNINDAATNLTLGIEYNITNSAWNYYYIINNTGEKKALAKEKIIAGFNYLEDGRMDTNFFKDNALKTLETKVATWDSAFQAGWTASETNYVAGLKGYITGTLGVDESELQGLNNTQMYGMINYLAQINGKDIANATTLAGLSNWVKSKFNLTDNDVQNLTRADLYQFIFDNTYSNTYSSAFGAGETAGRTAAVAELTNLVLNSTGLNASELAKADAMDGQADGNASIENMISVYGERFYNQGYTDGWNETKILRWLQNANASYIQNISVPADRNATINQWMNYAQGRAEYSQACIDRNTANLTGLLNDENINISLRNYIATATNNDYRVLLMNTTGNESYAVARDSRGDIVDRGQVIDDATFDYVRNTYGGS